jgi:hypothetical protein
MRSEALGCYCDFRVNKFSVHQNMVRKIVYSQI